MDMFMDKLAQRLNAQEIIKANAAADAEELNKLKDRVAEYNVCLDRLKKLLEEGSSKLEGARVNGSELNLLIEESIGKIREIQQNNESLEALQEKITERLNEMELAADARQAATEQMVSEQIFERMEASAENVHKECVKVYRNVQAVVTDESAKQNEVLETIADRVGATKGKISVILGVSIASLILSLGSIVFAVLGMLNFKFF